MPAGQWNVISSNTPGFGTLSGTAGALTTLLDQLLVNGNTPQSVTSITRSGSVATVTCSATHGFWDGTNSQGQYFYVTIAGAAQSDYNGTFLAQATGTTTFTYTVANSPATPATGTITWAIPGFGWTIPFTGTNKRMYLSGSGAVARRYLKLNDSAAGTGGAKEALVRAFLTAGDVDGTVNTGPVPTNAQSVLTQNCVAVRKSNTADSTARGWVAAGDDRTFYLFIFNGDSANVSAGYYFGESVGGITTDSTNFIVSAGAVENSSSQLSNAGSLIYPNTSANFAAGTSGITNNAYIAGDNTGANASTAVIALGSPVMGSSAALNGPISNPNLLNSGLYLFEIMLARNNSGSPAMVGKVRGIRYLGHPTAGFTDRQIYTAGGELAGRQFLILKSVAVCGAGTVVSGSIAIETTNPEYSV